MIIDIQFNQGAATWNQLHDAVLTAQSAGFSTARTRSVIVRSRHRYLRSASHPIVAAHHRAILDY
ncbi:MAG: hypothetical protein HQ486_07920 [Acidimicrobiaceae bacterium]|nr:hypothetical protein [Acidimicrobiaceae bacterium]